MSLEKQIDDLIEAGWKVIDADFDPVAFEVWKKRRVTCLSTLLGSDHTYTRFFRDHLRGAHRNNLVVGGGILAAASRELRKRKEESDSKPKSLDRHSQPHPLMQKDRQRRSAVNSDPWLRYSLTDNGRSLRVRGKRRITK